MMPTKNLVRMVVSNTLRSPRHFILSAFGIVIGIGAFVLFLALTQRAGETLEQVYPLDEVQVVAPNVAVGTLDATKRLDPSTVKRILERPEVKAAIPRMNLVFPAAGRGEFEDKDFRLELGGFVDGVDPGFVQDDARTRDLFRDWDSVKDDPNRIACVPPPRLPYGVRSAPGAPNKPLEELSSGWSTYGKGGSGPSPTATPGLPPALPEGFRVPPPGVPLAPPPAPPRTTPDDAAETVEASDEDTYTNPCPNPDRYYCDETERVCKHRVPVVLSSTVVEFYNTRFAKAHKMPAANEDLVNFLLQSRGLSAMRFSIGLNHSMVDGGGRVSKGAPRRIEAMIVGVSKRALQLGITVPIQYIERWNREYVGEEAATAFSSIIVKLKDRNQLAPFAQWLKDSEGLKIEDSLGEQFATVVFVIRLLFLIISIAILVVAVINIGHNFFVQVTERRREIGIMRAVGATETDVLLIVLGEAAMVGIVGGFIGIGIAFGIGLAWDAIAATMIPRFPFKPDSWFDFKPWIWGSALAFSTLFCILGGYLPARRAAKMEPAQALAQN